MKTVLFGLEYRARVIGACVCLVLLCPAFFVAWADESAQTSQSHSQPPVQFKQNQAFEDRLAAAARSWSAKDFGAVRASCRMAMAIPGTPPHFQSYTHLRIAQSYLAEKNTAAAKAEYKNITANAAYPEVHRYEAEECLKEIDRVAKGLPARDVTASRTKIPPITVFAVGILRGSPGQRCESRNKERAVCNAGEGPRYDPRSRPRARFPVRFV